MFGFEFAIRRFLAVVKTIIEWSPLIWEMKIFILITFSKFTSFFENSFYRKTGVPKILTINFVLKRMKRTELALKINSKLSKINY